jgi:hypothetical protein
MRRTLQMRPGFPGSNIMKAGSPIRALTEPTHGRGVAASAVREAHRLGSRLDEMSDQRSSPSKSLSSVVQQLACDEFWARDESNRTGRAQVGSGGSLPWPSATKAFCRSPVVLQKSHRRLRRHGPQQFQVVRAEGLDLLIARHQDGAEPPRPGGRRENSRHPRCVLDQNASSRQ